MTQTAHSLPRLLSIEETAKPVGNVYFIKVPKAIKIGYAKNVRKRIVALQVGNANKLKLMFSIPGTKEHEASIQNLFRKDRIRGEWYAPTNDVMGVLLMLERQGSWPALVDFAKDQEKMKAEWKPHPISDALMYTVERLIR